MATKEPNTIGLPGKSVSMAIRAAGASANAPPTTSLSTVGDLESVKHLLSDKPLQRPNRTRPIEHDDVG